MAQFWAIWPQGKIPYKINNGFKDKDREAIANAMDYLEKHTCLRFTTWTSGMDPKHKMTFEPNTQRRINKTHIFPVNCTTGKLPSEVLLLLSIKPKH